jgi:hypothetical protein
MYERILQILDTKIIEKRRVNTDTGEGEWAYEQVLEVGRGDVFLGLVRGEEAEVADHLVAAPQQADSPPDPFLPNTTNRPRKRSPNHSGWVIRMRTATGSGTEPGRAMSWRRGSGAGTPCRRGPGGGGLRPPPPRRRDASATASCY